MLKQVALALTLVTMTACAATRDDASASSANAMSEDEPVLDPPPRSCAAADPAVDVAAYDSSQTVIELHAGAAPNTAGADEASVKRIAIALVRKGFVVRAPDTQRDVLFGSGVEFYEPARVTAARDVTLTVNKALAEIAPTAHPLPEACYLRTAPRTLSATHLHVWLF